MVTEFVLWQMEGPNNTKGYKAWSLRDTTFAEALAPFM
jgi:hypothetical protein